MQPTKSTNEVYKDLSNDLEKALASQKKKCKLIVDPSLLLLCPRGAVLDPAKVQAIMSARPDFKVGSKNCSSCELEQVVVIGIWNKLKENIPETGNPDSFNEKFKKIEMLVGSPPSLARL